MGKKNNVAVGSRGNAPKRPYEGVDCRKVVVVRVKDRKRRLNPTLRG
jgi:hypothetical protein